MNTITGWAAVEAELSDLEKAIAGSADPAQVERLQHIRRARLAELEALRRASEGDR